MFPSPRSVTMLVKLTRSVIPNQPPPGRSEIDPPQAADSLTPEFPPGCRLLFAGGGTGGHLFPGIAVADACRSSRPDCRILFAGSNRPLESRILEQTCYDHQPIDFLSPRYALRNPLRFLQQWQAASRRAANLLKEFQPDVVVGLGGFASYPLLKQAWRSKTPIALLEQNAIPGRVTSLFARKAALVCLSYEACRSYLPAHTPIVVTGNPVRSDVLRAKRGGNDTTGRPVLVVCGGSQGSEVINQAMLGYARQNGAQLQRWHVRHQTGSISQERRERLQDSYRNAAASFEVQDFYNSPADLYAEACVLVGRAGGTTLAEIAALRIPSVLVPIPTAVRNHQVLNATAHLENNPGAVVAQTSTRFADEFASALSSFLDNPRETQLLPSVAVFDRPASQCVAFELARLASNQ